MTRRSTLSRLLVLGLAATLSLPAASQEASLVSYAPDRVLVRLTDAAAASTLVGTASVVRARPVAPPLAGFSADTHVRLAGLRQRHGLDRTFVLDLAPGTSVGDAVRALLARPDVEMAEPDHVGEGAGRRGAAPLPADVAVPDDAFFSRQWGLDNTGANPVPIALRAGADIDAPAAWDRTTGSPTVVIAVLDSGVRFSHPEFAGRFWANPSETPGNGADDDGNGYPDDTRGWDFANNDADPTDDHGHGTNVAGIVAATGGNGVGYAGIDWAARVMTLKVLDATNSGFYSWWSAALVYAADHGARVVNLSAGGSGASATLESAVTYARDAGATVVVSMMNANSAVRYYPAASDAVVAVGATNGEDRRVAPFCWGGGSSYGPHIDLVAPGDYMYGLDFQSDTYYGSAWCGTSQATPLVAGAAALALALDPSLTPDAVRTLLRSTAVDGVGAPGEDTPGDDVYHGAGRLNLAAVVAGAVAAEVPPEATASLVVGPSPARRRVRVALTLAAAASVRVEAVDALGRRVAVVHDGPLGAGLTALSLDVSSLPAGVYAVRAHGAGVRAVRTVVVAR